MKYKRHINIQIKQKQMLNKFMRVFSTVKSVHIFPTFLETQKSWIFIW